MEGWVLVCGLGTVCGGSLVRYGIYSRLGVGGGESGVEIWRFGLDF